jgi:formylglycine-generating enzyme required for sulfatase activity/serine/threonine protein kinase
VTLATPAGRRHAARVKLGPYEVLREIGRGGSSVVLEGRAPDGRAVALKLLGSATPEALARFERERRLQSSLGEAAGFVPLLASGAVPQGVFLVMPLVPGGTLRDRLRSGALGVRETVALGAALGTALGRAHALGIVHRDVKPENVLFTAAGAPLLADLGLAKHFRDGAPGASQSVALSVSGGFRGTAGYMAPEQIADPSRATGASDVFALGAILHECLTGRPVFEAESVVELLVRNESARPEPLAGACPGAPRGLVAAIERALARAPGDRFPDGASFARALVTDEPAPRPRSRAALGGAALSLVLGVAGFALFPRPRTREPAPPPPPPPGPSWYLALPEDRRPRLPLPAGLTFGPGPGEYRNQKDGSILVFVPAGSFSRGTENGEPGEAPVRTIELSAFFLGKYHVTNAQFEPFARSYETTAERRGFGYRLTGLRRVDRDPGLDWRHPLGDRAPSIADHPVVVVSADDGAAYCAAQGLRLPTEAEYEYAAGWDPIRRCALRQPWGDAPLGAGSAPRANLADACALRLFPYLRPIPGYDDGYEATSPVTAFPGGAAPCGALDLLGNVRQWCADGYDPDFYRTCPARDPLCLPAPGQKRSVRGAGFTDDEACPATTRRLGVAPDWTVIDVGFRVARSP